MESLTTITSAITRWASLSEKAKRQVSIAVLDYFGTDCRDETAIAALAKALADSGERCKWPSDVYPLGGIISTGGPSSLSTLLLYLALSFTEK
ncbi:hypothetical protein ES705_30802 [subsurface metagenome]